TCSFARRSPARKHLMGFSLEKFGLHFSAAVKEGSVEVGGEDVHLLSLGDSLEEQGGLATAADRTRPLELHARELLV
ncbi:hypothetical protein PMAYCL1PPCAC_32089, partial [Pristionchus mayeri]